jgi:hypothetical protein
MSSLLIIHLGLHNHKMLFRLWWHDMVTIATVEFVTASYPNNGSWSFLRILGSLLLTRQSITCQLLTITIIDCQGLAKSGLDMGLPGNRAHQFLMVKHSFNVPPKKLIFWYVCIYICICVCICIPCSNWTELLKMNIQNSWFPYLKWWFSACSNSPGPRGKSRNWTGPGTCPGDFSGDL